MLPNIESFSSYSRVFSAAQPPLSGNQYLRIQPIMGLEAHCSYDFCKTTCDTLVVKPPDPSWVVRYFMFWQWSIEKTCSWRHIKLCLL
ncbi:hypothetical protein CDEST_06427 [Colletotrichum destructivum]|uniref:Uncharacterized protein n=1 Tax=Colletotrichum destructivum TaxID=34406 RepID=A0AAX4IF38_9PEZI|nr:hypothetical protein CDEST_06427 [Colletotrichum destructivum]